MSLRPIALGQISAEYLVVFGTVLIISLVSISIIIGDNFKIGEKKIAQTQAQLRSTTPIAILEAQARAASSKLAPENRSTFPFLHLINNGPHPITLTKMLANNRTLEYFWDTRQITHSPIREIYNNIQPGEEFFIGYSYVQHPTPSKSPGEFRFLGEDQQSLITPASFEPGTAEMTCRFDKYLLVKNFGFEYEVNIDGHIITNRQIWDELLIRCGEDFYWCC